MTLGIGVIGTGIMGADHVETITTTIAAAEVRAIADIDLQRAEMIASRVPGEKALQSAESLIESPEVDGVIIASRRDACPVRHGQQRCARAGSLRENHWRQP
jgi:myo-inositol 2-dehydrogenase / D-chiro-inositol 1-dehydrogenase